MTWVVHNFSLRDDIVFADHLQLSLECALLEGCGQRIQFGLMGVQAGLLPFSRFDNGGETALEAESRKRHRQVLQLQLHLLRRAGRLAALGDILHAAARGLHHLVMGPAAAVDVAVAEPHSDVIGQLRHLKALQVAVAAVHRDERFRTH